MNKDRIEYLKEGKINKRKKYVLYWMQQSQRVSYNHALNQAITLANSYNLPLVCFFSLDKEYQEANLRSYYFMLEGLKETKELLNNLKITFILRFGNPSKSILSVLEDAQALVMDKGYLKQQRLWREEVLKKVKDNDDLFISIVDTDLIVPVDVASNKSEYGAYTLRPKIMKLYNSFRDFKGFNELKQQKLLDIKSDDDLSDIDELIKKLDIDKKVSKSPIYRGGYSEALRLFNEFINEKANNYPNSNDPSTNYTSLMSMYLHFGQISSLELLERLEEAFLNKKINQEAFDEYVEQLLVRRELAFNYVYYRDGYDQFEKMTEPWAYKTMQEHSHDKREYLYTIKDYETYLTHDKYFNAAMKEMIITGYMHNYMRMYWAKKIIEWSKSFKEAYQTILYLNNKYFIDGRDPNSYAGVAWCFGKHDRAWKEREVFGKLRYMNSNGLERKFEMELYLKKIDKL